MSLDIITSIRQTESQAEKIKKDALEEGRSILSEASKQAYVIIEQAIEEAEEEAGDIIKEAEKKAASETDKRKQAVSDEDSIVLQEARGNLKKAVDIIMERIVTINGNS